MGQKQSRLDAQFSWEAATQLLSTLRDLMTVLENRFQKVEVLQDDAATQADDLVNVGLARINEVLLPSVLRIQKLTSLGFLLAHSTSSVKLELAQKTFIVPEGDERDLFTPSGYVSIERESDYTSRAIAQVISYDNTLGFLSVIIVAAFGAPGPFTDWVISASPGVTEATRVNMEAAKLAAQQAIAAIQGMDADVAATAADRLAVHADRLAADLSAGNAAGSAATATSAAQSLTSSRTQIDANTQALATLKGNVDAAHDTLPELAALIDASTTALLKRVRVDDQNNFSDAERAQGLANLGADARYAWRRNRIYEPGMRVSQEQGNNLLTTNNGGGLFYPSDGFFVQRIGTTGGATAQRIALATPGGSPYRNRITVTAVNAAPAAGDLLRFSTRIEGIDVADLRFGSVAAKTIAIRLGVRSGVAGTFVVAIVNATTGTRSWVGTINIAPAEVGIDVVKSVTLTGDQTGAWATDNSLGFEVTVGLMTGTTYGGVLGWQAGAFYGMTTATNLMATNGATFDLFDVGLYDVTGLTNGVVPPFELASYAEDLLKCQRYFQQVGNEFVGWAVSGTVLEGILKFSGGSMRAAPSVSLVSGRTASFRYHGDNGQLNGSDLSFVPVSLPYAASQPDCLWTQVQASGTPFGSCIVTSRGNQPPFINCNARL